MQPPSAPDVDIREVLGREAFRAVEREDLDALKVSSRELVCISSCLSRTGGQADPAVLRLV